MPQPQPTFVIRPYTAADERDVIDIVNLSYHSPHSWAHQVGTTGGKRGCPDELRHLKPGLRIFVAVCGDRIVASVITGLGAGSAIANMSAKTGYVGMLSVHPDFQSRGLGGMLIRHSEKFCRANGAHEIVMDVLDDRDTLLKWYNRIGYVTTSESVDGREAIPGALNSKKYHVLKPVNMVLLRKTFPSYGPEVNIEL